MIDINAGCGHWAFRPTAATDAASLETLLRDEGIERACAYPLEAYFWPDPQEANEIRLPQLAERPFFVPSAVLNPTLPHTLQCYERCRTAWAVPLVRLMPGYHLYDLTHEGVAALAQRAEQDGVVLGVHLRAEDLRGRNPLITPQEVAFDDVVALARRHPGLPVIAFGVARPAETKNVLPEGYLAELRTSSAVEPRGHLPDNLFIDLSFWEYEDTFLTALRIFRPEQILLGTHAPLFYPRVAVVKIEHSAAPEEAKAAARAANARRLLRLE